jgi:hypothetical protein
MKAASINEIKKELREVDPEMLRDLCLRLAKYKKENKELLTYLLYEASDESGYVAGVKAEIEELFKTVPRGGNTYFIKKTLRKILRFANRQIKYSGIRETELEIRIFFCAQIKEAKTPLHTGTVLFNLYQQQVKKIKSILEKLPEDLQADYEREVRLIASPGLRH